jgi:hypothetical protein
MFDYADFFCGLDRVVRKLDTNDIRSGLEEPDHEARQHTSRDPDTTQFSDYVRRKAGVKTDETIEPQGDEQCNTQTDENEQTK